MCGSESEGHDESGASCVGKATVACSMRARDAAQPPSLADDPKAVTSEGAVGWNKKSKLDDEVQFRSALL